MIGLESTTLAKDLAALPRYFGLWADGTNVDADAAEKSVSDGSVVFDSASDNGETPDVVDWPLAEGDYDVYFFCCYENDVLAGPAKITINSGDGN